MPSKGLLSGWTVGVMWPVGPSLIWGAAMWVSVSCAPGALLLGDDGVVSEHVGCYF